MYTGTVVAEDVLLAVSMAMGTSSRCTPVPLYCWLYPWQWGSLLDVHRYRCGRGSIVGCIHGNGDLFYQYSGTVLAEGVLVPVSMTIGISSGSTPYRGGGGCIVGCIHGDGDLLYQDSGTVLAEGGFINGNDHIF